MFLLTLHLSRSNTLKWVWSWVWLIVHHSMQVWNNDVLLKTIDVKSLGKHGKIHEDGNSHVTHPHISHTLTYHTPSHISHTLPYHTPSLLTHPHVLHILTDHFGSFQLSSDGRQLLYIAEKEKPKTESYFKKENKSSTDQPPVEKVAILLCIEHAQ